MEAKVTEKIYWIGANDRRKELFENMWPLPKGVSYNSFLIKDEKTALLDTVELGSHKEFIGTIDALLDGRELDYLIINHMELDHSGEIESLLQRYPNMQIVSNDKAFKILEGYFGEQSNKMCIKDGDTLNLGHHELKFYFTPFIHWPETMMTFDTTEGVLFSGDAFGSFGTLDGAIFDDEMDATKYEDEMRRYYSNIVGKYGNMVQKAFTKLPVSDVKVICPLHGPIWRENPAWVVEKYDQWSKGEGEKGVMVVYGSMYGNTQKVAEYIARKLVEFGVRNVVVHDVSKTHLSYLISDLWKWEGVILGSCAYNAQMFPKMEAFTREIEHMGLKGRKLGLFGSYSWNGGGVRNLKTFAETIGWEMVAEPVDIMGRPTAEQLSACDAIAEAMAQSVK